MKDYEQKSLISRCKKFDPQSQKLLYLAMYDMGMSIAKRYATTIEDAEEIAHDGFHKMLTQIGKYKEAIPFNLWVRRIIINCGIDHYRKNKNKTQKINESQLKISVRNLGAEKMNQEYLLNILNVLSPQYKMVFVLYVIEGYKHKEISQMLKISIGASKSNLSKARAILKKSITAYELEENGRQAAG